MGVDEGPVSYSLVVDVPKGDLQLRIATWSVNGVHSRLRYLRHWLHRRQPDIVALQKIRISRGRKDRFPRTEIEGTGYRVEALFADDQWGSVAVLIRQDFLMNGHEPVVRQRGLPAGRGMDDCFAWKPTACGYRPYLSLMRRAEGKRENRSGVQSKPK